MDPLARPNSSAESYRTPRVSPVRCSASRALRTRFHAEDRPVLADPSSNKQEIIRLGVLKQETFNLCVKSFQSTVIAQYYGGCSTGSCVRGEALCWPSSTHGGQNTTFRGEAHRRADTGWSLLGCHRSPLSDHSIVPRWFPVRPTRPHGSPRRSSDRPSTMSKVGLTRQALCASSVIRTKDYQI